MQLISGNIYIFVRKSNLHGMVEVTHMPDGLCIGWQIKSLWYSFPEHQECKQQYCFALKDDVKRFSPLCEQTDVRLYTCTGNALYVMVRHLKHPHFINPYQQFEKLCTREVKSLVKNLNTQSDLVDSVNIPERMQQ